MDPTDEPALTGSRYVNQKYNGYYAYDPAKAKQLLTEAGYPNGFDMGDLSTVASWAEFAQVVQSELAAIGIKSTIRVFDSSVSLNATCWVQQKCSMFAGAFIQRADPTRVAEDNILPDALTNMGHSTPPETLRKLKLAEAGTSDTEHVSRVTDLMGQIVLDAPDLFVANVTTYVVYHTKVANLTATWDSSGFPAYGEVVITK